MRKNKSKKTKVPVLDEKGYAEYLDYLKREDFTKPRSERESQVVGANTSQSNEKDM